MPTQQEKAVLFHSLHKRDDPLVLYNIWDPGSAAAVTRAGASALATGSVSVAMAHGYEDGEKLPLDLALTAARHIVQHSDLPVSLDFEGAYAAAAAGVGEHVSRAMETGIVGINFEDQVIGGSGLFSLKDQVARIQAARKAIDASGVKGFLNARTDIFLKAKPENHSDAMVAEALQRAAAFADAGADGFFAPGLANEAQIAEICDKVALPVNLIPLPYAPVQARLQALGASRISYGPVPYRQMIQFVETGARSAYGTEA